MFVGLCDLEYSPSSRTVVLLIKLQGRLLGSFREPECSMLKQCEFFTIVEESRCFALDLAISSANGITVMRSLHTIPEERPLVAHLHLLETNHIRHSFLEHDQACFLSIFPRIVRINLLRLALSHIEGHDNDLRTARCHQKRRKKSDEDL